MSYTFRIDDISINTNCEKVEQMIFNLNERYPDSRYILGISPMVCDMSKDNKPDHFFTIKTDRWAFDNEKELLEMLNDFKRRV